MIFTLIKKNHIQNTGVEFIHYVYEDKKYR